MHAHAHAPSLPATLSAATMQAVVHDEYGSPDLLQLREIAVPRIGARDVLVRVKAAALHIGDVFGVRGSPFAMRVVSGWLKPKYGVPGFDLAGVVEEVGAEVEDLRVGDEVFGACMGGTCAQYVSAPAHMLAPKPASLSFEQAAAIATSAIAALVGLRDAGKVQAGQRVLINGAAGGIGTFAVQIAKAMGAEVTGVCRTENVELVRSLGADEVIDYTREDFTRGDARYDVIFDNVENRSLSEVRRALAPRGTLLLNSGRGTNGLATMVRLLKPLVLSPFLRQNLRRYLSQTNRADLLVLKAWIDEGRLAPVIDRVVPLRETAAALRHIEDGHARGKVVVAI